MFLSLNMFHVNFTQSPNSPEFVDLFEDTQYRHDGGDDEWRAKSTLHWHHDGALYNASHCWGVQDQGNNSGGCSKEGVMKCHGSGIMITTNEILCSHLPVEARIETNFDHPESLETDLLFRTHQNTQARITCERSNIRFRYSFWTEETQRSPERLFSWRYPLSPWTSKENGCKVYVVATITKKILIHCFVRLKWCTLTAPAILTPSKLLFLCYHNWLPQDADSTFVWREERLDCKSEVVPEQVLAQYHKTVRPMHEEWVDSPKVADMIVHSTGHSMDVAVQMLATATRNCWNRFANEGGA
jgi:uridine kinase